MPKQKDLKRVIRTRMQKTGESYTAARLHIVKQDFAALAGMSNASVKKATGRNWNEWVRVLDTEKSAEKSHRDIAKYVKSLGTPDWWSQMVTVGYERIRGLRERGQKREGTYEATKSRTFAVPLAKLYSAFANARVRAKWLPDVKVRTSSVNKSMRLGMDDGTLVAVGFFAKGEGKTSVAIGHSKLRDKETAAKMKAWWAERFDALGQLL